jgi:hypothetical protein
LDVANLGEVPDLVPVPDEGSITWTQAAELGAGAAIALTGVGVAADVAVGAGFGAVAIGSVTVATIGEAASTAAVEIGGLSLLPDLFRCGKASASACIGAALAGISVAFGASGSSAPLVDRIVSDARALISGVGAYWWDATDASAAAGSARQNSFISRSDLNTCSLFS